VLRDWKLEPWTGGGSTGSGAVGWSLEEESTERERERGRQRKQFVAYSSVFVLLGIGGRNTHVQFVE
jgi:hypothetical protein